MFDVPKIFVAHCMSLHLGSVISDYQRFKCLKPNPQILMWIFRDTENFYRSNFTLGMIMKRKENCYQHLQYVISDKLKEMKKLFQ